MNDVNIFPGDRWVWVSIDGSSFVPKLRIPNMDRKEAKSRWYIYYDWHLCHENFSLIFLYSISELCNCTNVVPINHLDGSKDMKEVLESRDRGRSGWSECGRFWNGKNDLFVSWGSVWSRPRVCLFKLIGSLWRPALVSDVLNESTVQCFEIIDRCRWRVRY